MGSQHQQQRLASSAAQQSINHIRELLGKSRVAADWQQLSVQQRAMLCYGAKLRPSTYAEMAIEDMTSDEREQIRVVLVEMKKTVGALPATDPQEWRQAAGFSAAHRRTQQEQERAEQRGRMKLNQQARQLDSRLSSLKAKSPVSGN